MAYTFVRDGVIYVRWKNAPDRTPKWPTTTEDPETGRPWKSEKRAKAWGTEQEVQAKLGLLDEPEPEEDAPAAGVTVEVWFARWWHSLDVGIKTKDGYEYAFRVYVLPEWGTWQLTDITTSQINAWEQRLISAGYKRGGVPAHARAALCTLLGDAVTEGLIGGNPALRQRNRGRRSGVRQPEDEKVWATPLDTLLVAERAAILSGRDDEFILTTLIGWTGLRWGETIGLRRDFVLPGRLRIDWQLALLNGRWYVLPPKDDSHRLLDTPPFLQALLNRQVAARPEQRCTCQPERIEGQVEQPCPGGGFVFLGGNGGHLRNSNFARRYFNPAADGRYPSSSGQRLPDGVPVLAALAAPWPGTPIPAWPRAVAGQPYTPPAGRGKRRAGLGVNAASSKDELVAYAVQHGASRAAAAQMTRQEILEQYAGTHLARDAAVASWLPVRGGLTLHGLRHGHSTLLDELRTPVKLRDERMGHASPEMRRGSMRDRYTHISDVARAQLRQELQTVWDAALAERAGYGLHSPVAVLDELLAPFRDGRRQPTSPFRAGAHVVELRSREA